MDKAQLNEDCEAFLEGLDLCTEQERIAAILDWEQAIAEVERHPLSSVRYRLWQLVRRTV
jgi:hypothetical protein